MESREKGLVGRVSKALNDEDVRAEAGEKGGVNRGQHPLGKAGGKDTMGEAV